MVTQLFSGKKYFQDTEPTELDEAVLHSRAASGGTQANGQEEEKKQQEEIIPEDFTKTMEKRVMTAIPQRSTQPPTICVVPWDLAEGHMRAYTPTVVCIGPFFDSQRETESKLKLERYKWCCVRKLILGHRAAGTGQESDASLLLHKCFDAMMRMVPRIRASYSITASMDTINEPSYKLAQKMLLDGCFVLRRLLKYARMARRSREGDGGAGRGDDDDDWTQVLGRCWIWGVVRRDLLLVNNQIPFFVVQMLFKHLKSDADERDDDVLVDGALRLFSSLHPHRMHASPIACRDVHHLLHLFYLSIGLPTPSPDEYNPITRRHELPSSERMQWVPCAKELEAAGVRLRARKRGATSFLDVRFRGGVLEIPPLQLFDYSEPLFRNLIAFEQTYWATPGHITAYAIFMDCLVKTPEDMRLLHQSGILVNHMNGDKDVTGFFGSICAEAHTSADRNYLAGVMEDVVKYQSRMLPRWRAALVRDYFSNPWVTTTVVVAAILLALTVLQSFYAVYAYYKPRN